MCTRVRGDQYNVAQYIFYDILPGFGRGKRKMQKSKLKRQKLRLFSYVWNSNVYCSPILVDAPKSTFPNITRRKLAFSALQPFIRV